jgi:purine-binding chemotaxis protein CheW
MVQLLTFDLSGRRFALPASAVREVTRAVAITALPKAPPIVEGVINVRGTVVPMLDIRQRFGLPPASVAPEQHLLIAQAGGRVVALRVDRAVDLVSVDEAAIESAARVVPGVEYVAGIAKLPDGLIVIHDLERFLSLEEAGQLDAAGEAAARKAR